MLITLAVAVACALLAWWRGRSWWRWALIGAALDIAIAILLVVVAKQLGINVRSHSGGAAANTAAWIVIVLPRIATLVTVLAGTRKPLAVQNAGRNRAERRRNRR
jgi:hypothetical protein